VATEEYLIDVAASSSLAARKSCGSGVDEGAASLLAGG
jgi:hypothetical protein